MGLLNAVVGGIAGGVAGIGAGLTTISNRWDDNELMAAKEQAEIARERRIEEAVIRSEGRQSANKANERQADLDFNTDPANVAKSAQAKIAGQSATDEYTDSRFPTELDQAWRLAKATHIEGRDTTDYAGRALDHQLKQQALDEAMNGSRVPDGVKEQLKFYDVRNKEIKDLLATDRVEPGSKGELSLLDEMKENSAAKSELIRPYIKDGPSPTAVDEPDPLGVRRDALMSEIQRITGNKQDLSADVPLSDLRKIIADVKKETPDKAESQEPVINRPKGLLSRESAIKAQQDRYEKNRENRELPMKVRMGIITKEEYQAQQKARK